MNDVFEDAIKSIPSETLKAREHSYLGINADNRKYYDSVKIPKERKHINEIICKCQKLPALKSVIEETITPS